jgi:hypothetical protein
MFFTLTFAKRMKSIFNITIDEYNMFKGSAKTQGPEREEGTQRMGRNLCNP